MSVQGRKDRGPEVTGYTLHSNTQIKTYIPWVVALLLLVPVDLSAAPGSSASGSPEATRAKNTHKAKKARRKKIRRKRRTRRTKKRRVRKARRKRSRRRAPGARKVAGLSGARCKDIFCTSRVMALEGDDASFKQLSSTQVEQVMRRSLSRLEPCLVQERRKNPHLRGASIEFVVSPKGRVLASRIQERERAQLQRCLQKAMRPLRFPRVTGRTVATFTVNVPR